MPSPRRASSGGPSRAAEGDGRRDLGAPTAGGGRTVGGGRSGAVGQRRDGAARSQRLSPPPPLSPYQSPLHSPASPPRSVPQSASNTCIRGTGSAPPPTPPEADAAPRPRGASTVSLHCPRSTSTKRRSAHTDPRPSRGVGPWDPGGPRSRGRTSRAPTSRGAARRARWAARLGSPPAQRLSLPPSWPRRTEEACPWPSTEPPAGVVARLC